MNIILIGYRGTGKSVAGQIISKELDMAYVGMDSEIVKHAGMPIPEIVEKFGWPKFRDLETQEALAIAKKDNMLVDTGGGIIERPENMEALQKNGMVFLLTASVDTIVERIQDGTQRPALVEGKTFTQEVAQVLEQRKDRYESAARFVIDTDDITPEQVAFKIIEIIKANQS
ncbi:MAG: shikimate kinase [Pseudomonadota bacterium]